MKNMNKALFLAWLVIYTFPIQTAFSQNTSTGSVSLKIPPAPDNPRNSEGDFATLKDGSILFIYTRFTGKSASDYAAAYLVSRTSSDGGKTWSKDDRLVVENEGGMNIMSVSLLRLKSGKLALFYLRKNSVYDCKPMMGISSDEGKTWGKPSSCIDRTEYYVLNNDRVIQLKSGRLLMPVALHKTERGKDDINQQGMLYCYYSDDEGKSWQPSAQVRNNSKMITQEPGVIELKDGRVMMFARTDSGVQQVCYSKDKGKTWSDIEPSKIASPVSPASIARIPATGDLLLVWNNNDGSIPATKGKRTPLTTAVSKDDGKTWEHLKNIEEDPSGSFCYTAIHFTKNDVLLAYFDWATTQITIRNLETKALYK
ncbi:glycoside hydrolase [Dyadobacter sp. CY327]|uniref:sialidase family protein n=1 Tax=Dyadobacter sp. CY327 TaxID=2907301 RepID=UPI001F250355|nr:sialidase family protein [Dyadobacter sp. CY327]MCE7070868.1 glycoside hydrolase [Dyadobacter sp. CY327]